MNDNRHDYEPIIAERRSRERLRDESQPLWRLVLALGAGLVVVVLLVLWLMDRWSSNVASTTAQSESSISETLQEERVEQEAAPPARDLQSSADISQAPTPPARDANADAAQPSAPPARDLESKPEIAQSPARDAESPLPTEQPVTPENAPEVASDNAISAPVSAATVSVRFTSPDTQVRIELRGAAESSPTLTSKVGDVVDVAPGTYRVISSGPDLETFEQDVTFDGSRPAEYSVELCAEPKRERESLVGQIVEERTCASTAECESMFMVLSEYADQLVKDRDFRAQRCAKWRPNAAPDGRWTLNTDCGGATLATTCRIQITEGACSFAEPRRSVRGGACPRGELK